MAKHSYKVHTVVTLSSVVEIKVEHTEDGQLIFETQPLSLEARTSAMPSPEPLDENGRTILFTDVPNDAAHETEASVDFRTARGSNFFRYFEHSRGGSSCWDRPSATSRAWANTSRYASSRAITEAPRVLSS